MKRLVVALLLAVVSAAQAATVTVVNYSAWDINYLYVSPSASNNWGPDQLGNQILGSNQQVSLKIGAGDWDVRLVDEDGDECVVFAIPVRGGRDTWEITNDDLLECESETSSGGSYSGGGSSTVTVINYSSWDINYLYVSPSASNNWGPDQLGNNILGSNQQYTLSMGAGSWDVRLVDEDGDECVVYGVDVDRGRDSWEITNNDLLDCQSDTNSGGGYSGGGARGTADLYNGTSYDIHQIYLSPTHQNTWGRDLLGNQILYTGQTFQLSNISCGNYDVRIVDEDADVCEYSGQYICGNAGTWSLTDNELLSCQGY